MPQFKILINPKALSIICVAMFLCSTTYAQKIQTEKRIVEDTVFIDFINPFWAPIEFKVKIKDEFANKVFAENTVVLKENDTIFGAIKYLQFVESDSTKNINEYFSISGKFGYKADISIDKDFEYALPYPKGKSYKILQGNKGKFSHDKPNSYYAIDFDMKIGDTITAARKGIVIFTKYDSQEFGNSRKYMGKANKVIVMHSDGTYGHYVHLKYNEVFVEAGMEIDEGQPLGLVGMSGFTTKPHLHFVVQRESEISIPIKYKNIKGKSPKKNRSYHH